MKHIEKLTQRMFMIPMKADSELEKQHQIQVWDALIKVLASLFDLVFKVTDKIKDYQSSTH